MAVSGDRSAGMNFPFGSQFYDREQPSRRRMNRKPARFHDRCYERWRLPGRDTINVSWFGYEVRVCPVDLWVYQDSLLPPRLPVVPAWSAAYDGARSVPGGFGN